MNRPLLFVACLIFATTVHGTLREVSAQEATKPEQISVLGEGKLTVPSAFKRTQPRMSMIEHEFRAVAGEEKEAASARITMMPARGSVDQNIERWKGQFTGGGDDAFQREDMKVGDWKVYLVDVAGNYAETMGGPFAGGKRVNHKDYAMLGAILVPSGGQQEAAAPQDLISKYFIKMIGPGTVVKANRKAFVEMVKSIEK